MKRLAERVTIVTGGASGIGRAIAARFCAEGARVVIADVDAGSGAAAAAQIASGGGACISAACDVSLEDDVKRLADDAGERFGRIDILVNNAADLRQYGSVADVKLADWNRSIAVGLTGTYLMTRHALPHMESGASVLNIASVGGVLPFVDHAVYVAVKGAVIQLTRAMALDFGARGIRANAIAPGAIETKPVPEPLLRLQIARSVLARKGRPEEIASAAVFLSSDEAAFITGACLPVDGGWLLGRTRV